MVNWQPPAQDSGKAPPAAPKHAAQPLAERLSIDFSMSLADSNLPKSLEQAIAQALVNHPDMRLAEAELRVAEAKLAQAKMVVSQKVSEDFHRLEKERVAVSLAAANWQRIEQLQKQNMVSKQEADEARHQLAQAKARLATTESAWKRVMRSPADRTGYYQMKDGHIDLDEGGNGHLSVQGDRVFYEPSLLRRSILPFELNPVFEVSRAASVKSVVVATDVMSQLMAKLGTRVQLEKQTGLNLEQAFQKVTEGAGLTVRVKLPITENKQVYKVITQIDLDANDYPLRTWLQLIVDEMNNQQAMTAKQSNDTPKRYELYVREYGLLLTSRDLAPPDAITVQELWKQSQFEKAAAEAKKTQENAVPKK